MGKGPLKPAPGAPRRTPAQTLVEDHLSERESLKLELQALRSDWLLDSEAGSELRQGLLKKAMGLALKSDDAKEFAAIFRAITTAELRQQQIRVAAIAARARVAHADLPRQLAFVGGDLVVNGQDGSGREQQVPQPDAPPTFLLVQQLLDRSDVRAALQGSGERAPE